MFAKLFESEKYGQILAKLDTNEDDKPEVRVYFKPPDLGVCSVAIVFSDDDEGTDKSEGALREITRELAEALVFKALPKELRNIVWPNAQTQPTACQTEAHKHE